MPIMAKYSANKAEKSPNKEQILGKSKASDNIEGGVVDGFLSVSTVGINYSHCELNEFLRGI